MLSRVDVCDETRDDGRRPLTAIFAPSPSTSSTTAELYSLCLISFFLGGGGGGGLGILLLK